MSPTTFIDGFAAEVGPVDPVAVGGGRTRWHHGGELVDGTRVVRAPVGIVDYQPEEMTVRVGAGTTVADLHAALAEHGQRTSLPERPGGTIGGALVVGESSVHRLGRGHVRDALLQAIYVGSAGEVVTAGGQTVKNVSGFDLCRLVVGSLGTIGLVAEVILRTRPIPPRQQWLRSTRAEPWTLPRRLLTASAVLWDGSSTWLHLEGHHGDVEAEAKTVAAEGFTMVDDGAPDLPGHRWAVPPAELAATDRAATGHFVAEVGVGTIHASSAPPPHTISSAVVGLNRRIKSLFDPTGRLNPGRSVV